MKSSSIINGTFRADVPQPPIRRADAHKGTAPVEIYQNCNVFNDGAYDAIVKRYAREEMMIDLKHGDQIRFGADGAKGVTVSDGQAQIVAADDVEESALLIHDEAADPSVAFAQGRPG